MPQISKKIPIKSYQNSPAVNLTHEYLTFLSRMHIAVDVASGAPGYVKRYCFWHDTRPYGVSFSIQSHKGYRATFFSSTNTGIPAMYTAITPNSYGLHCANQWQPTTFDLDFGYISAGTAAEHVYTSGIRSAGAYTFGWDQVEFICAPVTYYLLSVENIEASGEFQYHTTFKFADFLGVP